MDDAISAADANRRFSRILQGVKEGKTYIVTSHGKAVARILPAEPDERAGSAARAALLARLSGQPLVNVGPWTREELYEDRG
jgi:prevent-host-death family protein